MAQQQAEKHGKVRAFRKHAKEALASAARSARRLFAGRKLDNMLIRAAERGDNKAMMRLINAGADITARNKDGRTVLQRATNNIDNRACELLIQEYSKAGGDVKELIVAKDSGGWTSLHWAAINCDLDEFCALLIKEYAKAGGNVKELNAAKDKDGKTALHRAAERGHINTCALLLDNGADINTKDKKGNTALMLSEWTHQEDTLEFLKLYSVKKMLGKTADMFISSFRECYSS
jgi:serine/threonine-protein phosphatase 6 regulatory ankyrin repeat subunit A/serine/threonine-protein phosphatase 6 regulatory ankyrin repeat subunit B